CTFRRVHGRKRTDRGSAAGRRDRRRAAVSTASESVVFPEMRRWLIQLSGGLRRSLALACGAVLALLLTTAVVTAAQRYLFGSAPIGAEEAMIWLLLLLACLGFPAVAGSTLAMRIELFEGAGGSLFHRLRAVIAEAIVLAAGLALLSAGSQAMMQVGGTSPLLGISEGLRPAALAASGALTVGLRILTLLGEGETRRLAASGGLALLLTALASAGVTLYPIPASLAAAAILAAGILAAAPLPHVFIAA